MKARLIAIGALTLGATFIAASQGHATTLQECTARYKAAKNAGMLTAKWAEYKKTECGIERAPARTAKKPDGTGPVSNFSSPWGAPLAGARPN